MSVQVFADRRRWLIGLAALIALIAIVFAAGLLNGPAQPTSDSSKQPAVDPGSVSSQSAARTPAAGVVEPAIASRTEAADAAHGTPEVSAAATPTSPSIGLHVIRTGAMRITVGSGNLGDATSSVSRIARAAGGEVSGSSIVDDTRRKRHTGTITLRVPSNRFDQVMERLADVGTVRGQEVHSTDVTQEFVDVRSRLRHAQAVEARLMKFLRQTTSVGEALTIQDRLDSIQQQIEVEKGRMQYLEGQTSFATIEVAISEKGSKGKDKRDDDWGLGSAVDTSAHRFVDTIANGIVLLGGLLPLLIVAGVAFVAARAITRSRRGRTS